MTFFSTLGIEYPIIQAPMAGISTPELAAAVSNSGALGSIGIGAASVVSAKAMIEDVQSRTDRPFNVNVFVHEAPKIDLKRETTWLEALAPKFKAFERPAPSELATIYTSFADDDEMLELLVSLRVPVISFHFGVPSQDKISALRSAGSALIASATNLAEAEAIQTAGLDAVIAQGFEAGGHRGVFDPNVPDAQLSTWVLTRLLVDRLSLPVIAAGGIMDGAGIASILALGAHGAQLGTAFVACPESNADAAYREALLSNAAEHTEMTRAISGRPARCLRNAFTAWAADHADLAPPDYPRAYDAGKALNGAAKQTGEFGYGAQWAGQGAPLSRTLPAADLVETLVNELRAARA
ncbi:MAG: nitronate monooxygenase [Pseudomonadota bacterium]